MKKRLKLVLVVLNFFLLVVGLNAQSLYEMPSGIKTRWASAENPKAIKGKGGTANGGRKGSASLKLNSGESKILAEANETSGVIRRIWITINERTPETLRGITLKMYWDGAKTPAVNVPIGDFFNHGLGKMSTFENYFFSSPEGRSFNCNIPMPFRESMKIEVTNESETDISMFFYDVDYTIGDPIAENVLYFHAIFNQQHPTTLKEDFQILPQIKGNGRFLGTNISVKVNETEYGRVWWGEGEVKIYLDGDNEYPTLCGTGTEDYIGTAWGQGQYDNLYQGCPIADEANFEYAFYRYHVPDPIYFYEDIKVTIQQIGFAKGEDIDKMANLKGTIYKAGEDMERVDFSKEIPYLFFERRDNYSSCAYFYLNKNESALNNF